MIFTTTRWRLTMAALLIPGALALSTACGGGDDDDPGLGAVVPVVRTPAAGITAVSELPTSTAVPLGSTPTRTAGTAVPSPTPTTAATNGSAFLHGYVFPIAGGCLPKGDQLMPNAPRTYRNGVHEGVDFYAVDNCTAIAKGTQVLAARAGTVIRADLDYIDPTAAEMQSYLANPNTDFSLDKFRGRQVWVRHDDGGVYVTRYSHLSGIAPGIVPGTRVTAGQLIAFVGESGTPESLSAPGSELHLHFEMRVGSSFLGAGQTPAQVRALYQTLFSP